MKRKKIIDNVLMWSELSGEVPPQLPLIEIMGCRRVLIENHVGVRCYSQCDIVINVRSGAVKICGEKLELKEISNDQLVIVGEIHNVILLDGV